MYHPLQRMRSRLSSLAEVHQHTSTVSAPLAASKTTSTSRASGVTRVSDDLAEPAESCERFAGRHRHFCFELTDSCQRRCAAVRDHLGRSEQGGPQHRVGQGSDLPLGWIRSWCRRQRPAAGGRRSEPTRGPANPAELDPARPCGRRRLDRHFEVDGRIRPPTQPAAVADHPDLATAIVRLEVVGHDHPVQRPLELSRQERRRELGIEHAVAFPADQGAGSKGSPAEHDLTVATPDAGGDTRRGFVIDGGRRRLTALGDPGECFDVVTEGFPAPPPVLTGDDEVRGGKGEPCREGAHALEGAGVTGLGVAQEPTRLVPEVVEVGLGRKLGHDVSLRTRARMQARRKTLSAGPVGCSGVDLVLPATPAAPRRHRRRYAVDGRSRCGLGHAPGGMAAAVLSRVSAVLGGFAGCRSGG